MKRFAIVGTMLFVSGITIGSALTPRAESASASSQGQRVCVNKTTGVMRLASVKKCAGSETSRVFGTSGDTGPQGAQGPAGPAGPQGATGPQGIAGTASSAADVKTRNVTLRYLGATGTLFGGCGSGTSGFGSAGSIYSGLLYNSSYLSDSWNWEPINDCSITFKVIDQ
jgi:hypothetical protein